MSKKKTKTAAPVGRAELDEQIARMRALLKLMAPSSGSAALGAMRKAFPDAPLSDRVRALKTYR